MRNINLQAFVILIQIISLFKMYKILTSNYYTNYNGHSIDDLHIIYNSLKQQGYNSFVYFAGDSTLDNKYWILNKPNIRAINGYENILDNGAMIRDVCYWTNKHLFKKYSKTAAINTAVEGSSLVDRDSDILAQDIFIRENITTNDVLVVSVGGNDIALKPTIQTVINLGILLNLENYSVNHPAFLYFVNFFKNKLENYINKLIEKITPKQIIVCSVYYPCEVTTSKSWADQILSISGYNHNPNKLQNFIRSIYEHAIKKIAIDKYNIVFLPLYEILDSKNSDNYVDRVEPSVLGGKIIAKHLVKLFQYAN